jgi:regulator of sirC expression with transglutaminase-like and TPR domain
MDAVERFAACVTEPAGAIRLDVGAFCIARCAHPGLDVDAACARLDELAQSCSEPTFDGVRALLFDAMGFAGNRDDYGDPDNSFLDSVLERRLGIPITLSVLTMEVARRLSLAVPGIGMPGHFLVQDSARNDTWCDPFHDGALYDLRDVELLFRRLHGPTAQFSRAFLAPVDGRAILARMLTNLEQGRAANDPTQLGWMCALHRSIPDLPASEQERLRRADRSVRARWN